MKQHFVAVVLFWLYGQRSELVASVPLQFQKQLVEEKEGWGSSKLRFPFFSKLKKKFSHISLQAMAEHGEKFEGGAPRRVVAVSNCAFQWQSQ